MAHYGFGHHSHGGQAGNHGFQSGHPNQSASWNSALQGLKDNSTTFKSPSPSFAPVLGALFVFLMMFLGLAINWEAIVAPSANTEYAQSAQQTETYYQANTYQPATSPNQVFQPPPPQRYRVFTDR